MTDLQVSIGSPPEGWDATVSALDGSVFHSTIWAEYQRRVLGGRPVFLLGRAGEGTVRAGSVALLRASRWPLASWVLRDLVMLAHPCARPGDADGATDFMERVERWAREDGCARLRLDSFMSGASAFIPSRHGYQEAARVEFLVDLRQETPALWQRIRKDQRERIRRLPREGITIDAQSSLDDLHGLAWVRQRTQAKRAQRGQGYALQGEDELSERLYDHLVKQGAGRLFLARRGGEPVAGIFFATFNGRAYSVFSGSSEEGYRLGAQSGLFWTAVEAFKAEGFHELNRGGVAASAEREEDPLHGIYVFKLRLGTTPVTCRSGRKVLSPTRDALARWRDRVRG